jgi:hypothetical protein
LTVVDRFVEYRNRFGKPADDAFRRLLARAWNANVESIPGWPRRRLVEPPVKSAVEVEWEEFPSLGELIPDRAIAGWNDLERTIRRLRELPQRGRPMPF